MKKTATFLAAAFFSLAAIAGSGEKETYTVNTEKSTIFWTGKKVTGEHTGTLAIKGGSVTVEDGIPVAASFDIDMNSIVCTDLEDEGTNQKLVGHLKSDDFFGVKAHPNGQFVATSFTPIEGATGREANYKIKGTLTLKGISHEIEFDGLIAMKGNGLVSNGSAEFDRAKYDIRYGSGSFFDDLGDKTIYDEVGLTFVLSASK
ncbi:MAG TPA: YceI family protein [Cryomorphaceae bacterium]|nr:YceI family protein [Cryomorphaceae bacterium]